MLIDGIPTPCAVVDLDVVERNTTCMAERMTRLGVRLRPHVKTHKCVEAARLQVRGHFGGITVSTLAEARFFAAAGFGDVTYAVPLAPGRAVEAVALGGTLERLNLLVDSHAAVEALEDASRAAGRVSGVLLKVDCGYHRAGVDPRGDLGRELARRIDDSVHLAFLGILAHGGHSYHATDRGGIRAVAEEERDVTAAYAERLRADGIEVREVSIGSTPTMAVAEDLTGVTEARPGNYVFFDEFQAAIGSCTRRDRAFSVLVSVIGAYSDRAVVDGGALAFGKDRGALHVPGFGGFGAVHDPSSGVHLDDVELHGLSQEHGLLRSRSGGALELSVGDRLRVFPNHACLTAALHDRYHGVRGDEVVERWEPVRGW